MSEEEKQKKFKCLTTNERKLRRKNEYDRKRKNDILSKVALVLNPKLKKNPKKQL